MNYTAHFGDLNQKIGDLKFVDLIKVLKQANN